MNSPADSGARPPVHVWWKSRTPGSGGIVASAFRLLLSKFLVPKQGLANPSPARSRRYRVKPGCSPGKKKKIRRALSFAFNPRRIGYDWMLRWRNCCDVLARVNQRGRAAQPPSWVVRPRASGGGHANSEKALPLNRQLLAHRATSTRISTNPWWCHLHPRDISRNSGRIPVSQTPRLHDLRGENLAFRPRGWKKSARPPAPRTMKTSKCHVLVLRCRKYELARSAGFHEFHCLFCWSSDFSIVPNPP